MNRAVIYRRVSSKEQVENFSLSTQERNCRDYCARNSFDVDKVFTDEGESAKTIDRPQFQAMLIYCRENKGRVKWVVVYNVSRFSRNTLDYHATVTLLAGLGISVRSATEPLSESPEGHLTAGIMALLAEWENRRKALRTVAGMKAAIQAGKWTFKAPLGYLNGDGGNGSPSLIHDPERGPLVKQAFGMYGTGLHTKRKVLVTINSAGLRTVKGKPLSDQAIDSMLRNPVYAGWLQVKDWGERHRGDFEPLVNQDVFDRVQAILSGKRLSMMPRLRSHPDFPLRHFVKCGCCGRPLTASWTKGRTKRYGFYRCQNGKCPGVHIRKENLEHGFVEFLERMQPKPGYLKLFSEIVLDVWKEKQAQNVMLTTSLKHHIEDLNRRKEQLEDSFIYEKAIDRETYQRQLDKLNEQIVLAEMQERDAKLEGYDVEGVLNFADHVILNAARLWTEFSSDQKQRLQKVLFPQGVTFADGIYKTTETCLIFKLLQESKGEKSGLVPPPGIELGSAV